MQKIKQKEAQRIIREIINTLKDPNDELPKFILKKRLRGCTGQCDYDSITLAVFWDFFPTLIHELIHFLHDDWCETKVKKAESLVKHYIKIKEIILILKLFVRVL